MDARNVALEIVYDGSPTARMRVSGELDMTSAPWLSAALDNELDADHDVVVDLTAARLSDSTPYEAILRARARAEQDGRRVDVEPRQALLEAI